MRETLICLNCDEPCEIYEVTFDYGGTHCTHGRGGIHHTGEYESQCCDSQFMEISEYQCWMEAKAEEA